MTEKLKECQLCHQMLPKSNFYKRKDRDGEYTWTMSYCGPCNVKKTKISRHKNPEYYKEYSKNQGYEYYYDNKDKIQIIRKRYYYNKLPLDKKEKYRQKLQEKYPEIVDQICV